MSPKSIQFYDFANFRLDVSQKVLLRDEKPVALTPKVFDTLEFFLENAGRLLEKDELMQKIWQDRFVEESNLTSNIKMLRKALGDNAASPRFIQTVQRRGYRFVAEVKPLSRPFSPANKAPAADTPLAGRKPYVLLAIAVVSLISLFGIAFVWVGGNSFFKSRKPKFTRLTTSGKVTNAAVSPDGKRLVFSQNEGAGESLYLRQMDAGTQTQILPPQEVEFIGLAVSPDGQFAYFSVFSKNDAVIPLSRVALAGGAPEQIPGVDADVTVSFSPDGKKLAFTESYSSIKETALKIADTDGTNQRVLVKTVGENRKFPIFRASPLAWSPDGGAIACAVQETDENGSFYKILLVDSETGSEKYLSEKAWNTIENLVWKDAENLAFIEYEPNSPVRRIWQISRATGAARQLTDDLSSYEWLSSAGGNLFALRKNLFSSLHVADFAENAATLQPKQIFAESGVIESVGWSRDAKIFYNSWASEKNEIWQINPDGTAPRQLTRDSSLVLSFAVSPADDALVFSARQNGKMSLAAADANGQNIRRLTDGMSDILPVFAPGGENVIFQRGTSPTTLWSVPANGSEPPKQLTGYQSTHPAISPDGRQIAFHFMDYGSPNPHWKLGLIDSESRNFLNKLEFPMPVTQRETAWNPKTNLLTMAFSNGENSGILLWSPADGKFQTFDRLAAGKIGSFAWSPDGKRLVFSQIFENSDLVSLDNF
ncbi:MAG TPA: winged helix-turn-helix domain-containing protein [Pyrinomonadaceae bacterium]|jgi:DNA-binding winged helix-turn-helix (wHTH) protein/Tol biopolymer transport system component